ncbi:MAG TPA: EmrB/QacA family drug resistance transporter, partial [Acetobacteraceae bacterium]|nr:EmrB/QacA family drug resistance transporter [Acetobacteraceae bacterium]
TLMLMRMAQSAGLGFLFVPISTSAYMTLPRSLNADASALYVLVRNVAGSAAISLSTAAVVSSSQTNMAYLAASGNLSPASPVYHETLARVAGALAALGREPAQVGADAMGWLYQTLNTQAAFLAYRNVFIDCAIIAFAVVPFTFFLSSARIGAGGGGH